MEDAARSTSTTLNHHAVRFYESDRALSLIVAQFLDDGFAVGDPAVVIATPAQRAAIVRELATRSRDVAQLQRAGDLRLMDATEMLSRVMRNHSPDAEQFRIIMGEVISQASRGRENCTVRLYGQMMAILWENGRHDAAVSLEMLWNELATATTVSVKCGYALGQFYKQVDFQRICNQHTHLVSADGRKTELLPDRGDCTS